MMTDVGRQARQANRERQARPFTGTSGTDPAVREYHEVLERRMAATRWGLFGPIGEIGPIFVGGAGATRGAGDGGAPRRVLVGKGAST